jgi:anti-sigma regulatory factor (Ser/Thr protein kinase)
VAEPKTRKPRQNPAVREFILENVDAHPKAITSMAAKQFGLSRVAINRYMNRLIGDGVLIAKGKTSGRRYSLKAEKHLFEIELFPGIAEDAVWRFRIQPLLTDAPKNIVDICQYGFTEMLNNAIDHSESKTALISLEQTFNGIEINVYDYGVGIFEKIQKDFNLEDPRSALLELSKGKLTSNKRLHSGEGIYFTSRMFDKFSILSGNLYYTRMRRDDEAWLIETKDRQSHTVGTKIFMTISKRAVRTTQEVFEAYQGDNLSFRKTHVPVKLALYPGEQLVSRSQAKRVLARFGNFSEVMLDFAGVDEIGQPFADEIFRVFRNAHPETELVTLSTNEKVKAMINYVKSADRPSK